MRLPALDGWDNRPGAPPGGGSSPLKPASPAHPFSSHDWPPWGASNRWREINESLLHLVKRNPDGLAHAAATALRLQEALAALFSVMDSLCHITCRHCPDICCHNATPFLDFKDLLFIHLTGHHPPPFQPIDRNHRHCRFLGHRGCRLQRMIRPWMCTWYLCPTQKRRLATLPLVSQKSISEMTAAIKTLRRRMETEFICGVAPQCLP